MRPKLPAFILEKTLTDCDLRSLIVEPKVHLMAWTQFDAFLAEELAGWETDSDSGQALAEFAGRACYQSWSKPNPATATNEGYLGHILEVGHDSVLEHGQATLYLTGVSRGFTHELVRHRHGSYSQLSQRYVDQASEAVGLGVVIPPAYRGLPFREQIVLSNYRDAISAYEELVEMDVRAGKSRKQAREAARSVLPNCAETRIVVTGNFRAWRELISKRATVHADAEMREVAVMIAKLLKGEFPHVFQDMHVSNAGDVEVIKFLGDVALPV